MLGGNPSRCGISSFFSHCCRWTMECPPELWRVTPWHYWKVTEPFKGGLVEGSWIIRGFFEGHFWDAASSSYLPGHPWRTALRRPLLLLWHTELSQAKATTDWNDRNQAKINTSSQLAVCLRYCVRVTGSWTQVFPLHSRAPLGSLSEYASTVSGLGLVSKALSYASAKQHKPKLRHTVSGNSLFSILSNASWRCSQSTECPSPQFWNCEERLYVTLTLIITV